MSLRDSPLGELKVPLTWTAAVAVIVAIVAVVALLVSDRRDTYRSEAYGATRGVADQVLSPVGDALSAPGRWTGAGIDTITGYFFAVSENRRLKAELKEMRQWRDVALALRNENGRYRSLLGLKTDPPIPMVAARVVTDSRGPFASTRLANAGREKGIKVGNPVMSETGLVGRIIGVTSGASRVLLLTDTASKVPVMIDRTNARAILTGDGGPNPKLDYLRGQNPVKEGDRVMTSGDGGVIPRGLPVGTAVKGLDGRWRVVLAADKSAIDFVQVLLFQDFTQLANQRELAAREVPPPTAGALTITPQPPSAAAPAGAPPKPATPAATAPSAATNSAAAAKPSGAPAKPAAAAAPKAAHSAAAPAAKPVVVQLPTPRTVAGKPPVKDSAAKTSAKPVAGKSPTAKPAAAAKPSVKAVRKPPAAGAAARPTTPKPEPPKSGATSESADEEPPT